MNTDIYKLKDEDYYLSGRGPGYIWVKDGDKWIHSKSLELIKKGFDSDEAFIIACKLYDEKKNT